MPSGLRLYKAQKGRAAIVSREALRGLIEDASAAVGGHKFSLHFLLTEWEQVVDAWQLENWEAYRDVMRLGRKTRLPEAQRAVLWAIFERVRAGLKERNLITYAELFSTLAYRCLEEQQPRLRFRPWWMNRRTSAWRISGSSPALGWDRPNALFFRR